ncbi:MFS transporter [Eubacteriales bacterium DFI.9.88]|nr:MFS transporter [Eubacteriales bacterium DFI.9.88]
MDKLKTSTKILYGIAGIGDSALYNFMGTFALFFLTTVAGVDPAVGGTIVALGSICETIAGAVIGYVSDNTATKYGKRKPFLLAAAFPLTIITCLFFANFNMGMTVKILYYGAMMVIFWTFFSVFFVPYLAWGAELTQDYNERTVLRGYVYFFNMAGVTIGMILPNLIVDWLGSQGFSLGASWQITAVFCGVCAGVSIFIAAVGIKDQFERNYQTAGKEAAHKARTSMKSLVRAFKDMLGSYWEIMKSKTVLCILGASVFYLIAYAIFSADRMYFLTYNMKFSPGQITAVLAFLTFSPLVFLPLIIKLSNRWDKRSLFLYGMSISTVMMLLYGVMGIHSMAGIFLYSFLYSIGNICYWQLIPSMIYDVSEVDELIYNKKRTGLVISLQSLSESLANAVGVQLLGIMLSAAGFDGEVGVQADTALLCTHLSFTVLPAVFMGISILIIVKYPVTRAVYDQVLAALKAREAGEDVDMEAFERLR